MKKILVGLFLPVAMLTTGCIGNTAEEVVGKWQYLLVAPEFQVHKMIWDLDANGQIIITDSTDFAIDTGSYEVYMDDGKKILKISNTDIKDPNWDFNVEWCIIRNSPEYLVVSTKDHGGVLQRDLVKL